LIDPEAPACGRTDIQTQSLISAIGNNDVVFNIGESFSYDCNDVNVTAAYTNSITVNATGVTSSLPATDTDTSVVTFPG